MLTELVTRPVADDRTAWPLGLPPRRPAWTDAACRHHHECGASRMGPDLAISTGCGPPLRHKPRTCDHDEQHSRVRRQQGRSTSGWCWQRRSSWGPGAGCFQDQDQQHYDGG